MGIPRKEFRNLSHYKPTDPDMNRGDRQKCLKACGNAFPPHDQTTILLLEPGKRPLGLEPRHHLFDGSPRRFLGLPDPLGELGSYTPACVIVAGALWHHSLYPSR